MWYNGTLGTRMYSITDQPQIALSLLEIRLRSTGARQCKSASERLPAREGLQRLRAQLLQRTKSATASPRKRSEPSCASEMARQNLKKLHPGYTDERHGLHMTQLHRIDADRKAWSGTVQIAAEHPQISTICRRAEWKQFSGGSARGLHGWSE